MKFGQKLHLACRMKVYPVHQISARLGDLWGKIGLKIALETSSPSLNTGFCWKLNTSLTSGGERRCDKHIKICARMGDLWGEIRVQTSSSHIICFS